MPFAPLPQTWFPSLTDDGTVLSIDIDEIPELTAAEIDAATGDIRKFLFAWNEACWAKWVLLAAADKPTKMTLQKNVSVSTTTGIITNVYTYTFLTAVSSQEVVGE
jgi:hypothetical protein